MTISRRDFVAATGLLFVGGAAGKGEGDAEKAPVSKRRRQFRAGAAASNITPPLGVSLDGTIMQIGPARHIHDELYARCVVLDDGRTRVAIVVCDVTMVSGEVFDEAKNLAQKHTGLPVDRMLMSATHTHMAPRMIGIGKGELDRRYRAFLARRISDAVARAVHNLAPAKVGWGVGRQPEFVHNRRWLMKPGTVRPNPFGGKTDRVAMQGRPEKNRVQPAGPVDAEVSVLSVQHADGRLLALLANYGLHYVAFRAGQVSSDYFGRFAKRIARLLDADDGDPPFVGMMSNGTSGDVGGGAGSFEAIRKVGDRLAETVLGVCKQIEHRDDVSLAMCETEIKLDVRCPDKKRLQWARQVLSKAEGKKRLTRPEVYAREAMYLSEFPPKVSLKLQALRVGDLGIAAIPCEVFAETGLAIKKASPLKPTFTIGLANGYNGYLPTARQHELGGYETWPARSSYLPVRSESKVRAAVMGLLGEVALPLQRNTS